MESGKKETSTDKNFIEKNKDIAKTFTRRPLTREGS
jgi:hypothetical protein